MVPRAPSAPALPTLAPPRASDERCGGSRPAGAAGSGRARWSRLRDLIRSLVGDRISRGTAQTTGRVTELRNRRRRSLLALNLAARGAVRSLFRTAPEPGPPPPPPSWIVFYFLDCVVFLDYIVFPKRPSNPSSGPSSRGLPPPRPARSIGTAAGRDGSAVARLGLVQPGRTRSQRDAFRKRGDGETVGQMRCKGDGDCRRPGSPQHGPGRPGQPLAGLAPENKIAERLVWFQGRLGRRGALPPSPSPPTTRGGRCRLGHLAPGSRPSRSGPRCSAAARSAQHPKAARRRSRAPSPNRPPAQPPCPAATRLVAATHQTLRIAVAGSPHTLLVAGLGERWHDGRRRRRSPNQRMARTRAWPP